MLIMNILNKMDCQEIIAVAKRWVWVAWERVMGRGNKCDCECCRKIKGQ